DKVLQLHRVTQYADATGAPVEPEESAGVASDTTIDGDGPQESGNSSSARESPTPLPAGQRTADPAAAHEANTAPFVQRTLQLDQAYAAGGDPIEVARKERELEIAFDKKHPNATGEEYKRFHAEKLQPLHDAQWDPILELERQLAAEDASPYLPY